MDSSLLLGCRFVVTIVVVTMWIILRICGLSTQESAEGGWVLADVEPESIATFFSMTYGSLSKIDFSIIGSNMGSIVASAFVGPVMNVSINVVVLNGMLGPIKGISFGMEFLGQSLGSFLSCVTFGFSSYMTVADTGLMIKAGGRDAQPVLMMVAFMVMRCSASAYDGCFHVDYYFRAQHFSISGGNDSSLATRIYFCLSWC